MMTYRTLRSRRRLCAWFGATAAVVSIVAIGAISSTGAAATAAKPVNTSPPTVSGTPQEDHVLTGDRGTWTNNPSDFNYFWMRCDKTGGSCSNIVGAHALTYTLTSADVGNTIRFRVQASNGDGSTNESSVPTAVIAPKPPPPTVTTTVTVTNPPPAPPAVANQRPTIRILTTRFVGARLYVRMRVCDDSHRNLAIPERDSKPSVLSYTRQFATLTPPFNCAALTRNWLPAPRFRHGQYTVTLWARDKFGKTSFPARRTFFR
jgi:hypothetical protein